MKRIEGLGGLCGRGRLEVLEAAVGAEGSSDGFESRRDSVEDCVG